MEIEVSKEFAKNCKDLFEQALVNGLSAFRKLAKDYGYTDKQFEEMVKKSKVK